MMNREAGTVGVSQGDALPEFCSAGMLLVLVLLGFSLSLLVTLAGLSNSGQFWQALGLNALFVLWVGLFSLLGLCWLKKWLRPDRPFLFMVIALLLVQVIVAALSLLVWRTSGLLPDRELLVHADPLLFVLRNLGISIIVSLMVIRYLVLHLHWKSQVAAESRARLDSLQARIRPHFLFNALNTISSLIHERPDQAEQATMDLSDLLRTGLKEGSHHSLAEELDLVRGYLRIESLRLGDRLKVEWALADDLPLDFELPALMIQPLVENGVVHGIARLPEGGTLQIRGERSRGKRLRFVIENPVPQNHDARAEGNRMALDNIRQRLELAYEEGGRLKTRREDGQFQVELILPIAR